MRNVTLNPGGLGGAILGMAVGVGIGLLLYDTADDDRSTELLAKLCMGCLFPGAYGGNWLWARWRGENSASEEPERECSEEEGPVGEGPA